MPDIERAIRERGGYVETLDGDDLLALVYELLDRLPLPVTCRHCGRTITYTEGGWIDPEATGDDSVWRWTCDEHDTFVADHEPTEATAAVKATRECDPHLARLRQLLVDYDAYEANRAELSEQESEGNYPRPNDWEGSDDTGCELADAFALAITDLFCTGTLDPDTGIRQHPGATCPIHDAETDAPALVISPRIFALLTRHGTAMADTALCAEHVHQLSSCHAARKAARQTTDWDGSQALTDCTGNEELRCLECGAAGPASDAVPSS